MRVGYRRKFFCNDSVPPFQVSAEGLGPSALTCSKDRLWAVPFASGEQAAWPNPESLSELRFGGKIRENRMKCYGKA